jgi:hypothetical protein
MLDPRTSDDAAQKWTLDFFHWIAYVESETQLWYEALVEQIAIGMVSCAAVTNYNQQAERLYYWQAWVWDKFDPLWAQMRARGLNIPADPSLPKLIGTVYNVYGGRRQLAKFAVTVPCQPNGLADASQLQISGLPGSCSKWEIDPGAQPPPAGTVWSGTGMLDLSGGELGLTVGEMVFGTIVVVGVVMLGSLFKDSVRAITGTMDGSTIAQINAQMAGRQIEQDRKRAQFIAKCEADTIARMGALGTQLTLAQQAAIQKQCETGAVAAYPDRTPPYAKWGFGQVMLAALGIAAIGGGLGVVYLVTRDRRHGREHRAG